MIHSYRFQLSHQITGLVSTAWLFLFRAVSIVPAGKDIRFMRRAWITFFGLIWSLLNPDCNLLTATVVETLRVVESKEWIATSSTLPTGHASPVASYKEGIICEQISWLEKVRTLSQAVTLREVHKINEWLWLFTSNMIKAFVTYVLKWATLGKQCQPCPRCLSVSHQSRGLPSRRASLPSLSSSQQKSYSLLWQAQLLQSHELLEECLATLKKRKKRTRVRWKYTT